jgi:hypothetical protein
MKGAFPASRHSLGSQNHRQKENGVLGEATRKEMVKKELSGQVSFLEGFPPFYKKIVYLTLAVGTSPCLLHAGESKTPKLNEFCRPMCCF